MNTWENSTTNELFRAILALSDIDEAKRFFRDLLTEKEILEFANRWKVAQMLENKVSYINIEKETGMSSTTIARVQKWLTDGMGGYKLILARLNHHTGSSPSLEKGLR